MNKVVEFVERFFSSFASEGAARVIFDKTMARVEKGLETSPEDRRVETSAFIAIDLKEYSYEAWEGLDAQRRARYNWESGNLYGPLDENKLEKVLTEQWFNLRDKPEKRLEVFKGLGMLGRNNDPTEFNRAIENLIHDPAMQLAKWGVRYVKKVARPVNRWGRWFVITMLAIWPVVMIASALTSPEGKDTLILLSFLLPVVFMVGLLAKYPLFMAIFGAIPVTRTVLIGLGVIIGFEMVVGMYLIWVPVHLAPTLLFVEMFLVAIAFLLGVKVVKEKLGWISSIATLAIVVITIIFFQKDTSNGGLAGQVKTAKNFAVEVRDAVAPQGVVGLAKGAVDLVFPTSDSTIWAEVGDPNLTFKELPAVDTVRIIIPPGQWWSIRYTRSPKARYWNTVETARYLERIYYEDGSYDEFECYPGLKVVARAKIMGVSYMNPYYSTPIETKIVQNI